MDPTNVLATQGTTVLLIPLFVQWMKESDWIIFRWISEETAAVNRAVSWVLGVTAALGIHLGTAFVGGVFTFSVDLTQFSLDGLLHETLAVGGQLGGQQLVYRVIRVAEVAERVLKSLQPPPAKG